MRQSVAAPASKFGGQSGQENFSEQKCKICFHFYAEIVKFGLILAHLTLFWEQTGGGDKKLFGLMWMAPPLESMAIEIHGAFLKHYKTR